MNLIIRAEASMLQNKTTIYPFKTNDAGRSSSKRPNQKNDCTVRAVALARALPYDTAYELMAGDGRKCSAGFDVVKWLDNQTWAKKIAFPAVKGQKRMNPVSFTDAYPKGIYICRVAKHVFTVIDGVVQDTFVSRPDRCIYTAWLISTD